MVLLLAGLTATILVSPAAHATEPGESPQLYVASGDGYLVAFKVEGGKTYVLGLDARVYCAEFEPQKVSEPTLDAFFSAPTPLRELSTGDLSATAGRSDQFGRREAWVSISPEGGKLIGAFEYGLSEQSYHCQTGGYFGSQAEVSFEAVPYEPVDGLTSVPPFVEAPAAVYYGREGPLETFFSVFKSAFGLRGTVASGCLASLKKHPRRRGPLASTVLITTLGEGGSFHHRLKSLGPSGLATIHEAVTLAGTVGDEAITGTYLDRIGIRPENKPKRVCNRGPLPFRAARYLPSAVPYAGRFGIRNSRAG